MEGEAVRGWIMGNWTYVERLEQGLFCLTRL